MLNNTSKISFQFSELDGADNKKGPARVWGERGAIIKIHGLNRTRDTLHVTPHSLCALYAVSRTASVGIRINSH